MERTTWCTGPNLESICFETNPIQHKGQGTNLATSFSSCIDVERTVIFLASLGEKSATRSNLFRRNIGLILGMARRVSIAVFPLENVSTFFVRQENHDFRFENENVYRDREWNFSSLVRLINILSRKFRFWRDTWGWKMNVWESLISHVDEDRSRCPILKHWCFDFYIRKYFHITHQIWFCWLWTGIGSFFNKFEKVWWR